jgi:hypothetical protein
MVSGLGIVALVEVSKSGVVLGLDRSREAREELLRVADRVGIGLDLG